MSRRTRPLPWHCSTDMLNYFKAAAVCVHMKACGGKGRFSFLKTETARVFPEVLPLEVCQAMSGRVDRILLEDDNGRIWRDSLGSDSRIFGFENDIPDLIPYLEIDRCLDSVDAYLGSRTRSWTLMANKLVPKKGNAGSGGGFHRDSPFSHQVKCIWYLGDVDASNGPFSYVPGTHRGLLAQHGRYPLGTYRFDRVPDEIEIVTAPAGSLLVCDTRAVHGGSAIAEGVRYAVTLYPFSNKNGAAQFFRRSGIDPAASKSVQSSYR